MITDYMCRGILAKILTTTPLSNGLAALAVNVNSALPSGSSERLDFLGTVAPMREWVGVRQSVEPIEYNFTIKNRKFESTILLPKDWIVNDKTGNVSMAQSQLANRYSQWRPKLIADLMNNAAAGGSYLSFDGLSFYNSAHTFGQTTVNNVIPFATGGGPALITAYEAAKSLVKAIQQILTFLDDRGEPINEDITDLTVVVPAIANSQMAAVFFQAVKLPKIDTGSGSVDNPVFGIGMGFNLHLLVTPRIVGNSVHVINTSANAVPFVFQENKAELLMSIKGAGSDFEHDHDAWEQGLKSVGNAGFGRFTDAVQIQYS